MKFIISTIFFLISGNLYCQNLPEINSGVLSNTVNIGEQINYFLNVEVDTVQKIEFPEDIQIIPMEVLEVFPTDTQKVKNKYLLTKKYAIIQFDSGFYQIPPQRVLLNGFSRLSNSVKIRVNDIKVDTIKQNLFEIKPFNPVNRNYDDLINKLLLYLVIIIFIVGIVYALVVYRRKISERNKMIPPFEKAIKALKELEKREPIFQEEYKKYYSELTDVVRRYLEEEANIDALESTSDQLLLKLELYKDSGKLGLEESTIKNLKTVLNTADLVKFARAVPEKGVVKLDRTLVEKVVVETKEVLPEPTIEELKAKKIYEEMLIKKKRKQLLKIFLISIFTLMTVSLTSFITIFGYYPVIDTLFGYPTKKLIDNNWVISQYGSPPIKLSTPKILERKITSSGLSTLFVLDSIQSKYFFELLFEKKKKNDLKPNSQEETSVSSKEKTKVILDQTIKRYQDQGAVNILMETENYETPTGLPTLKISGTLDLPKTNNEEATRCSFTTLIIDYDKGKVSMSFIFNKDDRYGKEINRRIINSIELIEEL
ncbi:MAG: hypothetical protein CMC21_05690 [Flavobacteriaceae bacterium]|nr:hypothetical protein [Flavobacteriaceae bacterium]